MFNLFNDVKQCPICIQNIRCRRIKLECNHIFHRSCLRKWKQLQCPLCRKAYTLNDKGERGVGPNFYCSPRRLTFTSTEGK